MRLAPQIMSTQLRVRPIRKTDQCEAAHLAVGATPQPLPPVPARKRRGMDMVRHRQHELEPIGNALCPFSCASLLRCSRSVPCCGIATLTQRPMDNKQFPSGDVAEWLKAAVC
jgi:hypothetical protein